MTQKLLPYPVVLILFGGLSALSQKPTEQYNRSEGFSNEIVIRLRNPNASPLLNLAAALLSTDSVHVLHRELGLVLIHSPNRRVSTLMSAFANRNDLLYVEPNFRVKTIATPNDPNYAQL